MGLQLLFFRRRLFLLTIIVGVILGAVGLLSGHYPAALAEEQISDAQLLAAKDNTLKIARMAAQMGAISAQEAAELERKVAPMTAQEFKAYLEAETATAQNQQDVLGDRIDEKQFKKLMRQYRALLPTDAPPNHPTPRQAAQSPVPSNPPLNHPSPQK
ncbi:MAG: hypothetical protein J6Y94_08095 [Bacteriovoracaceae bacterium]|nr:hypothetical protein [Bacteriovoracaceae bacterium]